jgi:hypothetical protein
MTPNQRERIAQVIAGELAKVSAAAVAAGTDPAAVDAELSRRLHTIRKTARRPGVTPP